MRSVASPLQRLHIKPELPPVCMDLPRTEQRGVAMVLKALPVEHGEHRLSPVHSVPAGEPLKDSRS